MKANFTASRTDLSASGDSYLVDDYIAERLILPGDAANVVMTAYTSLGKTTLNCRYSVGYWGTAALASRRTSTGTSRPKRCTRPLSILAHY